MQISRRGFVSVVGGSLIAGGLAMLPKGPPSESVAKTPIKAIAFDAFPIFDPRAVFDLVDNFFPNQGTELSTEWRTRQFEYTRLRVAAGRYADFWQVTHEALVYATNKLKVELSEQHRDALMNAYLELKTWPDVLPALKERKKSGYRLAILSNFAPKMLDGCIRSSGLEGIFEQTLSTDHAKTFKPDQRAYQLGVDVLELSKEEILFVAFAGWDAAGRKCSGIQLFGSIASSCLQKD